MRIYTPAGDLAHRTFTFPDGQPHVILETYEREFGSCTIETALKSGNDLLTLLLASDVLRQHGYGEVNLDIRYLLGARMDRAIDGMQPYTLQTIARLINGAGFSRVRILDVHSETAIRLIRNSQNLLPWQALSQALYTIASNVNLVIPDAGAQTRVDKYMNVIGNHPTVLCGKKRDSKTGELSGFQILSHSSLNSDYYYMIVDDICDGGATFTGLAKELRKAGAKKVYLFCTHGIFSKGLPIEGIYQVYTTDSYNDSVYGTPVGSRYAVTIPISLKEMK